MQDINKLQELVRPNIWALEPYSCARDEFKGMKADIFLDANESPFNEQLNRYPDPLQEELKVRLAPIKGVRSSQIFLGNGSDEAIDLVYRIFCEPRKDNVVAIAPTYGMYQVCAEVNDIEYRQVSLNADFSLDAERVLAATDANTKVIWLCSPNNPTGNDLNRDEVLHIIHNFQGIVVVDEAYADFSELTPLRYQIDRYPHLIVLNTFSKAWASASIRLGMAFSSEMIINLFNKVKYPYNVNRLTQEAAIRLLQDPQRLERWKNQICSERDHMLPALAELPCCKCIYPTSANFVLVKVTDAKGIYQYLVHQGIVVRNRHNVHLCNGCLRITIGTRDENCELLKALRNYKAQE